MSGGFILCLLFREQNDDISLEGVFRRSVKEMAAYKLQFAEKKVNANVD